MSFLSGHVPYASRTKICEDPKCNKPFLDASKNRQQRFCCWDCCNRFWSRNWHRANRQGPVIVRYCKYQFCKQKFKTSNSKMIHCSDRCCKARNALLKSRRKRKRCEAINCDKFFFQSTSAQKYCCHTCCVHEANRRYNLKRKPHRADVEHHTSGTGGGPERVAAAGVEP